MRANVSDDGAAGAPCGERQRRISAICSGVGVGLGAG